MGLGAVLRVGMDDDIGRREGLEHPVLGGDHHVMRLLQAELRIQVRVHLDVHIGARGAGPQLVHAADARVGGHAGDDLRAVRIGKLVIQQLERAVAEHLDRPPHQPAGDDQARRRVQARGVEHGRERDPDQGEEVRGQVHQIVHAVARHGHRGGPAQNARLGVEQENGQQGGDAHHADGPPLRAERRGRDQVGDRLAPDQGGGGEHQARLQQAGESLALAVAVAVLAVRRGGGVAHGHEGPERGDHVQRRVGQRGQGRDRAGDHPGRELQRGQDQGHGHGQARDAARQGGGFLDRERPRTGAVVERKDHGGADYNRAPAASAKKDASAAHPRRTRLGPWTSIQAVNIAPLAGGRLITMA